MFHQLSLFDSLFDDLFGKRGAQDVKTGSGKGIAKRKEEQIFFRDSPVELQRKPYQRSMNLLVRPNGALKITAGQTVPARVIQGFLLKNSRWIEKHLSEYAEIRKKYPPKQYLEGERFLFKGQVLRLHLADSLVGKAFVEAMGQHLVVRIPRGQTADVKGLVRRFYEREGKKALTETLEKRAQEMELWPKKIRFKSLRSQWGNCSARGTITLNWRLAVFPERLWDYVVVHELAHLRHPNHSDEFWALVEKYCGNYKTCRRYLRDHHYEVDFLGKKSDLYVEN